MKFSSMLAIENNRKNHPILNQMYDLLTELHNQGKQFALCKVAAHTGIKGNEEAAKQAIDMPEMTTTRLPYTYYYLTIRRSRNSKWESAYNSCRQYEVKQSKIWIGNTRLIHGYLMLRNEQPPTCRNPACGNQRLTIKHCLQDCPQ